MKVTYYLIKINRDTIPKYVFNKRTLLFDSHLAKPFNSFRSAQKYLENSEFKNYVYEIVEA